EAGREGGSRAGAGSAGGRRGRGGMGGAGGSGGAGGIGGGGGGGGAGGSGEVGGRGNCSPERSQAIANRQQYWNKWSGDNRGKINDFRANRSKDWSNINNFRKNENLGNRFNSSQCNN